MIITVLWRKVRWPCSYESCYFKPLTTILFPFITGSPHCDSNGTLEEGQTAMLLCVLPFSGSNVDWRVDWEHGDRKLSSINEDAPGLVKRYVTFRSAYRDSGVYNCIISNRIPAISTQCTTALSVTREYHLDYFSSFFVCLLRLRSQGLKFVIHSPN